MDINTYTPNIMEYLPEVLKRVADFQALYGSENPEFEAIWNSVRETMNNQFIDDLTAYGTHRWEEILNISPNGDLDNRKLMIKARINENGTYTMKKLEQTLSTLCGENGYICTLNAEQYTLVVRVKLNVSDMLESVDGLLKRVVPANLVIDLSLLYNQHSVLSNFTHLELSTFTQQELREQYIIANLPAVQVGDTLFVYNVEATQSGDELTLGD